MADTNSSAATGAWTGRIAVLAIIAAVLVLLAGPLMKFGVVPWQAGLLMFVVAAAIAGIAGIYCLVALLRRRGGGLTIFGAAAGLAALLIPVAIIADGSSAPAIHDITTDTANPPQFVAVTPVLRGAGSNPVTYDPADAPLQAKAFAAVRPLVLVDAPAAAFDKAMAAVKQQGWDIVAADAATGRIEATDTVPWWGFKDDIVVRLTPEGSGTKVDVRSKSRVGKGDLGVNAKRITDYLAVVAKG